MNLFMKAYNQEYEPIYKARQSRLVNEEDDGMKRRRRRSGPDDDDGDNGNANGEQQSYGESKRFYGVEEQQQNAVNANLNAGFSSTLL